MLDAHADLAGDITAAFHNYSHDEARDQLTQALAHFRPDISQEQVGQVLALFESFSCEPARRRTKKSGRGRTPLLYS